MTPLGAANGPIGTKKWLAPSHSSLAVVPLRGLHPTLKACYAASSHLVDVNAQKCKNALKIAVFQSI